MACIPPNSGRVGYKYPIHGTIDGPLYMGSHIHQQEILKNKFVYLLLSATKYLQYSDTVPFHMLSVFLPLKMDKGGPRTALFRLCKILQWPMPKFEFVEQRFRYV